MRTFKVGDEVHLVEGTAIAGANPMLQQARGRVTGAVPDGTDADRITVEYPDGTKLQGVDAVSFKRAGT